ncbi:MAG: hypothetical protein WBK51_11505 [Polaromonas sp.]
MKKLALATALALTGLLSAPAHAATTNNNFDVTVNLTSACLVNTAATALNFGAYTAFGSAATPAPTTSITFKCTRGLTISGVAFDTGSGAGVVAGLNYGMTVGTVSNAAGTAATASVAGTADVLTYVVTGSMLAGQAGAGAGGAATSARVLTITY